MSNTQEDLDELYIGPEMPLQDKYGYMLTLIFTDMTFSPGMPLFNLITLMNLSIFYLSDKYCLLFFFRKPPNTSAALPKACINCLYVAALIHMANGVWMFGNKAFSGGDIGNSYTVQNVNGVEYFSNDHVYETDIIWMDRAINSTSLPLAILLVLFGGFIMIGFIRAFFVDILGLKTAIRALGNYLQKNAPAWNFIGVRAVKKLGLPPYFDAIPSNVVKQRFAEHTLDPVIEARYLHILQEESADKAKMGLSFTVEKSRLNRVMRAADKYEHRRRESLMRMSLSDSFSLSLDNVEARHDVAGFVADNIDARNDNSLIHAMGNMG
eukprot:GSChrysophyteH2.ASY1.ANO1.98.1 assembled CDS